MNYSDFFGFIVAGGFAMWVLLVMSVIAVAIVIERLLFFASQHSDSKGLLKQIGQRIAADDLSGAIKICQQQKGMLPKILEFGLLRGEKNRADITDALSIALMENLNTLERNLGAQGQLDPGRRCGGRLGSPDHDCGRAVRCGRRRRLLQLLQDEDQGVQPGDDRRLEPAGGDAALPQHRRADSDRAVPTLRRDARALN